MIKAGSNRILEMSSQMTYSSPSLIDFPILYSSDVIVAGGSFAGISAALVFALSGKKVTLVDSRTYLGREVTATLRPWLNPTKYLLPDWLENLYRISSSQGRPGQEIPLHLDQLKLYLEDLLIAAGVNLLYASTPVQILTTNHQLSGMVIGNKSGRQILLGNVIIDTSETSLCARLAGAEFQPDLESAIYSCTLELTGAQDFKERIIPVSDEIGVEGNQVFLHESYAGANPMYLEFALRLPAGADLHAAMQRDFTARFTSLKLAGYLLNQDVRFYWGNWAGASYELYGPHTPLLHQAAPDWAKSLHSPATLVKIDGSHLDIPITAFAGPIEGLWCLNESTRLSGFGINIGDPTSAACLGQACALSILNQQTGDHSPNDQTGNLEIYSDSIPVMAECSVLVVGGGTSGATAAAASGRLGATTVLVEMNPGLGGTGTLGGIVTYWMGNRVGFVQRIQQVVEKIHQQIHYLPHPPWMMWNHQAKMFALLQEALDAGVEVYWNVSSCGVIKEENTIKGALLATRYGPVRILSQVSIDATGDGDLAVFAGADHSLGEAEDNTLMWTAFPYIQTPGAGNSGNFTEAVDVTEIIDLTRGILTGRRRNWNAEHIDYRSWPGKEAWASLQGKPGINSQNQENQRSAQVQTNLALVKPLPLEQLIHDHGIYIAPRESRHISGDVILTLTDQLRQRKWTDVIGIMFSNYDVKGASVTDWNRIGLLPPNLLIEIPYRAILPRGLDGILVVGKAFSARSDAVPSIRMQPDLENLGGAAGIAAALSVKYESTPRLLDIKILQHHLVQAGVLEPGVLARKTNLVEYSKSELSELVKAIQPTPALWEYNNMPLDQVFTETIPLVELISTGHRSIPILEAELTHSTGDRAVLISQCLALLGSNAGVPVLIDRLHELFSGEFLPPRKSFMFNANRFPPDQGAMPEPVYLLYPLGMVRDPRSLKVWEEVADLLEFKDKDVRDPFAGPLLYIDAVCYGAERLGDSRAIPILEKIHQHPLLHNFWNLPGIAPDFIQERLARTEISLARALARCGSREGYQILIRYLAAAHSLHVKAAHQALKSITHLDYPIDRKGWQDWLDQQIGLLPNPNLKPANVDFDLPDEFYR